jgi:hypothetical protein
MNSLTSLIKDNVSYIIIALIFVIIVLLILNIILSLSHRRLAKTYNKFMAGANGKSLESQFIDRFADLDKLKTESDILGKELDTVKENLLITYQKVGVVKYDAFREMGGKLSFVLVLLDKNNSGFLLNSVHSSREGCYTYLKEIIKGESFIELSEDEKSALSQAINSGNYMA